MNTSILLFFRLLFLHVRSATTFNQRRAEAEKRFANVGGITAASPAFISSFLLLNKTPAHPVSGFG